MADSDIPALASAVTSFFSPSALGHFDIVTFKKLWEMPNSGNFFVLYCQLHTICMLLSKHVVAKKTFIWPVKKQ